MTGRAGRLVAVVAARRIADQGRLAACLAAQQDLRLLASALRQAARAAPAGRDGADMVLTAHWQGHLRDDVRVMLARVAAMEPEADRLRAVLAVSLGREKAVEALVATEREAARRHAERRAEDAVPDRGSAPYRHPGTRIG